MNHCESCAPEFLECWSDSAKCRKAARSLAAPAGSADVLKMAERLVEAAPGQAVVIIRHGDRISIRDNSGITGLTGGVLMRKTTELLDELFPRLNAEISDG